MYVRLNVSYITRDDVVDEKDDDEEENDVVDNKYDDDGYSDNNGNIFILISRKSA